MYRGGSTFYTFSKGVDYIHHPMKIVQPVAVVVGASFPRYTRQAGLSPCPSADFMQKT
jgi:hypothetical protein